MTGLLPLRFPLRCRTRRGSASARLRRSLPALLLAAAAGAFAQAPAAPAADSPPAAAPAPEYVRVEIDDYLQSQRPALPNSRLIVPVKNVRFDARIEGPPEERNVTYLFTALKVMGVTEMPKVNHRLVLTSPQGRPFAVYVPAEMVETLRQARPRSSAQFYGLHVYNYANGPAILLTGVALR